MEFKNMELRIIRKLEEVQNYQTKKSTLITAPKTQGAV